MPGREMSGYKFIFVQVHIRISVSDDVMHDLF